MTSKGKVNVKWEVGDLINQQEECNRPWYGVITEIYNDSPCNIKIFWLKSKFHGFYRGSYEGFIKLNK